MGRSVELGVLSWGGFMPQVAAGVLVEINQVFERSLNLLGICFSDRQPYICRNPCGEWFVWLERLL
jgi:hypothetical protein